MSISENIKTRRIGAGLSQTELANRVGVNRSMIAQIERGTKGVSLALAAEFANIFRCNVDDLVDRGQHK